MRIPLPLRWDRIHIHSRPVRGNMIRGGDAFNQKDIESTCGTIQELLSRIYYFIQITFE